ncbi:hypothetical protein Bca52824_036534 [Brassica carinata]|uniref:Replication factor A C-terminal domain-containing protein n=1 Tax=Brassica carinata TaxID=52824 RepID=A0A8X7V2U0_BRACI|nr:hypothetical protein Bca52824_036534 [Brassica carinata]
MANTGRSSSTVEVRLLRFSEARNVRCDGDLMGIDMLLLDSQATMMPANVNVHRLTTHLTNLKAGSIYSLTRFDVTRCNQNYRLSDSSLLIRFSDSTSFVEVTELAVPIPNESFRFRNHSEMLGLASSNKSYCEITAVKSTVTDPPQDKNRVMSRIKMEDNTSVTMSLFDAQAIKIHNQAEKMGVDPRVVVATSVNPKMVAGRLFLNATSSTHIYFDKETDAGERFFYSYAKVEKLSIAEFNDFVVTAPSQGIDFICTGKVTGIKMDKGWCYVSCSNCYRKLQRSFSSFTCVPCNNTSAVGVLRYRVEMAIADETGEGLFVGFDGVMAKLHNMRAYEAVHLLAGDGVNPEETDAPPFVKDMEGKTYTFRVRVGSYNFTANHQTFTIWRIISVDDRVPRPEFVDNGGDDDDGDDNHNVGSVHGKVEVGSGSKSGGASAKVKKAHKA